MITNKVKYIEEKNTILEQDKNMTEDIGIQTMIMIFHRY